MQLSRIKKWGGVLPAEEEKLYRQYHLRADSIQASIVMLILAIPLVAFAYNDYHFMGPGPAFFAFMVVRLVLLGAAVTAVIFLLRNRSVRVYD